MIVIAAPYILLFKKIGPKIAVAIMGVKFGGWGINLDMTKINIKLKINYSFSYIAFSSSWLTS